MIRLIMIICIIGGAYAMVIAPDAPYRRQAIKLVNDTKSSINQMLNDAKKSTKDLANDAKKSTNDFADDVGL